MNESSSRITGLLEAVAEVLEDYGARICLSKDIDRKDLNTLHVFVLPAETEYGLACRNVVRENIRVRAVFLKRVSASADSGSVLESMENAAARFPGAVLAGAVCVRVCRNAAYDLPMLRENNVFSGCLELEFHAVRGTDETERMG